MKVVKAAVFLATTSSVGAAVYRPAESRDDIPNRVPEAPPYVISEARTFPPPYDEYWQTQNHPGQCKSCHQKIFDEWNGSMMSNSWRDPVWRGAFLLLARAVSTNGDCDTPAPPDGTKKASVNPFAEPGACASDFDIGTRRYTVSRPGSLLDGFCSRCHMPANYVDNVPISGVHYDAAAGIEVAKVDPHFNPTSDNGTGMAFATLESQHRNTDPGRTGIFCAVCHTYAATRDTPFHNYARYGIEYQAAEGTQSRTALLPPIKQDIWWPPDPTSRTLGYSIGAGSYRLSPHAIVFPERFGPLAATAPLTANDENTSSVFGQPIPYQHMDPAKHAGYHQAMFVRSEMCAACHDVTNSLPIKNPLGKWVGGFPIERTYTEWSHSRYADRPGNKNFDPRYKRDCQSCHMQQDYGQPGTAQTLYENGHPLPPIEDAVANDGKPHPFFTHHFVGGNSYSTRLVGKDVDQSGNVAPYPELSSFSYSSADPKSVYSRAFWTNVDKRGAYAQQERLAWDRLRHVLSMSLEGPASVAAGAEAPISVTVANTGSGHNFPTGFPEGRTSWLAVHAYDLATGAELPIHDAYWNRTSRGVGNLTSETMIDPNFPGCNWKIPAGSADPYSVQFKAVASLGDGCPTLDLPYATSLNLRTNSDNLPIDATGHVVDASAPRAIAVFEDLNHNGDLFDDSYLRDTRFKPMPMPEATKKVDRYSVVVPPGTKGPIAITSTVYYQSVEAIVAEKVLGNLADTDDDFVLEPCVLGGRCDGRTPKTEPAVVEGAPPVAMVIRNLVVNVEGAAKPESPPMLGVYPVPGAGRVYQDAVVKVSFSEPVHGVNASTFTLADGQGNPVPAWVDQIGDGTWGLFPNSVLLKQGETYTARLKSGVCGNGGCTDKDVIWSFTVSADPDQATGDTRVPRGFSVDPHSLSCRPDYAGPECELVATATTAALP